MIDKKPYLVRAIYQWIVDNDWTPHLVIAAPAAGWVSGVPEHLLQDEFLILNISPSASPDCVIDNEVINFSARFQGKSCRVSVAMEAVASVVARENGEGLRLEIADDIYDGPSKRKATMSEQSSRTKKTPTLKIIK